ncbi:lipocalin-like domain-containing protein [Peribacillus castrilensis]|uniref:lipocalin-like domain-containing protein n=1 Tax=Bacillaceae TaxID=186817 RepID=UPI000661172D|nr:MULTISPECIES: lipocalin-like domain-containing protein [Bacillaceae]PRA79603.1 hydroxyneurosporene dehydrogenase [Peribacillus simplex]
MSKQTNENHTLMRLANSAKDYQQLGIDPVIVKSFEDGMRMDGAEGTYEWWYFDAHLDNGAKMVVVFFTKPYTMPHLPLSPFIRLNIELPDGRSIQKIKTFDAKDFSSSRETCDVKIGDNRFYGDLQHYSIQAELDEVSVDVQLEGQISPWRPKSGHMYYGEKESEQLFAWLPSVPQGKVSATFTVGDEKFSSEGVGYHDHNWGDAPVKSLIHHWYWGRAEIGNFTVIAANITAAEEFEYIPQIVFMLAKDGEVVADDESAVTFSLAEMQVNEATGKPVGDIVKYETRNGDNRYVVTFEREKTILASKFIDQAPAEQRAKLEATGEDGAYLRFTGYVTIEHFVNENRVDFEKGEALWELMYFGHAIDLPQ